MTATANDNFEFSTTFQNPESLEEGQSLGGVNAHFYESATSYRLVLNRLPHPRPTKVFLPCQARIQLPTSRSCRYVKCCSRRQRRRESDHS
jgi:hypothetical protein